MDLELQPKDPNLPNAIETYLYTHGSGYIEFLLDTRDGRVRDFTAKAWPTQPKALIRGPEDALGILQRVFRAAGYTESLRIKAWTIDGNDVQLECHLIREGVYLPTYSSVFAVIGLETGHPSYFSVTDWPRLSPLPKFQFMNAELAKARVLELALANDDELLETETVPVARRYQWVHPKRNPEQYNQKARTEAAYEDQYSLRPTMAVSGLFRSPTSSKTVFVAIDDATGELLERTVSAGLLGEPKPRKTGRWDLWVGTLRVRCSGKSILVPFADIDTVPSPTKTQKGVMLFLERGRWNLRATYYPASGLLSRSANGRKVFGKPNAQLLARLNELSLW